MDFHYGNGAASDADPADASRWGGHGRGSKGKNTGAQDANGNSGDEATAKATLNCTKLEPVGPSKIPPRPWAYGHYLLAGKAAALAAVDGGGKGAMSVIIALSLITKQPLLGEHVWIQGPVAVLSYEDDDDEWHRRIAAACLHYDVDYEFALDNIRFLSKGKERICFGSPSVSFTSSDDLERDLPDSDQIIEAMKAMGAVLLIVDPFNQTHGYDDGNSNATIARVAAELDRVAVESGAAVLVLHHLRKGATGEPDDMMGATSLRATFRSSRVLARMTKEEAAKLGVKEDLWRYTRISGTKENYAPPPDKATWFRLGSLDLQNGTEDYPDGDSVQATTRWTPTPLMDGVDVAILAIIFHAIKEGPGSGWKYSPSRRADKQGRTDKWVGHLLVEHCDKTPDQAAAIVKRWLENEVLIEDDYINPDRNRVKCVTLNAAKASEILGTAPYTGTDE